MDTIRSDRTYTGANNFTGETSLPAACLGNTNFGVSDPLAESKQEHRLHQMYSKPGSAVSETVVLHIAYADGATLDVACGSVEAAVGNSTVTVDIKKNGTTILSSVVILDSGNVAYAAEVGTINDADISAGDVLTAVIVATVGTGTLPTGLYIDAVIQEDAA